MSTASGTKSKLRETLKQEDAALAQRSRRARTPAVAAKVAVKAAAPAAVSVEVPVSGPTWIGVDASGDQPLPEWMTGRYQREKGRPGVVPYAIINPIRVAPAEAR